MDFIEQKVKHLEMIQDVIKRMAANSFQLKAWTVGVVSAVLALIEKSELHYLLPIIIVPILMFWGLDAYFLRMERLYRQMYDAVRLRTTTQEIDFSLDFRPFEKTEKTWLQVALSRTLAVFYGLLLLFVIGLLAVIALPA